MALDGTVMTASTEMVFSGWPRIDGAEPESSEAVFEWLVRLRWVAVLGVALVLVSAGPVFGALPTGSARWLWATTAGLLAYNAMLAIRGPQRRSQWLTGFSGQIAIDCLALATLVHLAGGIDNPFLPLFVLHVVNANIVLSGRAALGVLLLAIALVTGIVLAEGSGLAVHHCLRVAGTGTPCAGGSLDPRALGVLGGLVLTLVASSLFTRFLTARLRSGRRRLEAAVDELTAEKHQLAETRTGIESERARLQAIIDCMRDAVVFRDPRGDVLFSNRSGRKLWRTGGPPAALPSIPAAVADIGGDPAANSPLVFEHADRAFEATRSVVRSGQGATLGLVMVARDVTDRLAMDKRLMHEEQMSVVGKLAAVVAHEINNPIGVVSLYSQHALAKLSPDSPVYKHLEIIRRNADGCRTIVAGLLKLARPPKPQRRWVDLRQLCHEAIDSVGPLAARAGARLSSGSHRSEVPIWAMADAGMLHQAVLNLVVNAIEAASPGDEVSIGAYETQDGNATAQAIEVRDTGAGIPPSQIEQVFRTFFTTKSAGTGLGLAVADSIIKSHGGRIEVESRVGAETTCRIILPERPGRDRSPEQMPRRLEDLAAGDGG